MCCSHLGGRRTDSPASSAAARGREGGSPDSFSAACVGGRRGLVGLLPAVAHPERGARIREGEGRIREGEGRLPLLLTTVTSP